MIFLSLKNESTPCESNESNESQFVRLKLLFRAHGRRFPDPPARITVNQKKERERAQDLQKQNKNQAVVPWIT
jgi:hypothetical protein